MKIKSEKSSNNAHFLQWIIFFELFSLNFFIMLLYFGAFCSMKGICVKCECTKKHTALDIEMCEHIERKYKNIFISQIKKLHCFYFLPFYIKKSYFPGKVNCLFDLLVNSVSHTYGKFTTICFQKFIFFPYFMQKNIFLLHNFHKTFLIISP